MNTGDMEKSFWRFYHNDYVDIAKLLIKLGAKPTFYGPLLTNGVTILSGYHNKIISNFYIKNIHTDVNWTYTYEIMGIKENE